MTRQLVLKQVSVLFYLLLSVMPVIAQENFLQTLTLAHSDQKALPLISQANPNITPQQAYQIQRQWVQLHAKQDRIIGYKAGLTSSAGQKKFAVDQALSGVLFHSGHLPNNQARISAAGRLMLETEIGFILKKPIDSPITSRAQLANYIHAIVPIIELPDLDYQQNGTLKGVDLIAGNLASHQFITGNPLIISAQPEFSSLEKVNQIGVRLTRYSNQQSELVLEGKATDALGDQLSALLWLINHLLAQGYPLLKDHLLITGALGKMVAAQSGQFSASFTHLGQVDFVISE